jgi:hypothetical protein
MLTTHPYLVLRSRMSRNCTPLPVAPAVVAAAGQLYLILVNMRLFRMAIFNVNISNLISYGL